MAVDLFESAYPGTFTCFGLGLLLTSMGYQGKVCRGFASKVLECHNRTDISQNSSTVISAVISCATLSFNGPGYHMHSTFKTISRCEAAIIEQLQ